MITVTMLAGDLSTWLRCINFLQLYCQIWDLRLRSFSLMLPCFVCYDHCNYARWGPVYLAEMHQLPTAILSDLGPASEIFQSNAAIFRVL